jgi:hypothetical protein
MGDPIMGKRRTAACSLAVFALAFSGAIVDVQGATVVGCGTECSSGTYGTGGERSGGRAQGGLFRGQEQVPPGTIDISNAGNADAGNIAISGAVEGTGKGTFRNGVPRGRYTGVLGECTGYCD